MRRRSRKRYREPCFTGLQFGVGSRYSAPPAGCLAVKSEIDPALAVRQNTNTLDERLHDAPPFCERVSGSNALSQLSK